MNFTELAAYVGQKQNLTREDSRAFLSFILDDERLTDEDIAKALTTFTDKGETLEEILGFVDAMQARMVIPT